jgi:hypothetical protein
MFNKVAIASVVFSLSASVWAETQDLNKYLTIKSVAVTVETETASGSSKSVMEEEIGNSSILDLAVGVPDAEGRFDQKANIGQIIAVANQVIALGEKIYEIVKKGQPIVNTSSAPISVLPKNIDGSPVDMFQTSNWSMPLSRKVKLEYKNGFGSKVVVFDYTVMFVHSGRYNGKGAYLTAVQIVPTNVSVSWGYEFDATMKLVGLQNHGTVDSPVAGAIVQMSYKAKTVLRTIDSTDQYHVTGRGQLTQL